MKSLILVINLSILLGFSMCRQSNDIVKTEGITSDLHKTNIGRIVFMSRNISQEDIQATDFLKSYILTSKSDLFITAYLGNSLTNSMHKLAPDLSPDSLAVSGNYQFALSVDNKLVYSSNLLPGAPSRNVRDSVTVLSVPLINNTAAWWKWSQYFWGRFMNNGGDSALTQGSHLLRMDIRPYVNIGSEVKVGDIMASGTLELDVKTRPVIDISKISLNPVSPYNDLDVSTKNFNKDLIKTLKGNINEGVFKSISSIIVLKDGKILIEEYFNGESRDSFHDPRSVGKSIASSVAGIAINHGILKDENQTLKEFYNLKSYDNFSESKENVSIKDLLTMSSVFDGNDDDGNSPGNEENMYPTNDWVKFALDLPVSQTKPKDEWHYFTAGVVLLGDILNKTVPGGLEKYADQKLFKPLGITKYQWQYTPQNVPNTAGGIRMNALDFAKYGQLYKNMGKWKGKQIIPEDWINRSFKKHNSIPGRNEEYYGYLFWNKNYMVKGNKYETYYSAGNGGNKIYVFPDHPFVIVITATAYGAPFAHSQNDKMMTDYILPAITE